MPEPVPARTRKRASIEAHDEATPASLWRRIGRASVIAVAGLLPWFFLPLTPAPSDAAKFLLVAVAATVGLVALLADTIERRRLTYPGSLASLGVLAVVVTAAFSAAFSAAPSLSIFGSLVLPDSLAHLTVAALMFVLAAVFLRDRRDYVATGVAFVAGTALASLLAILGLLGVPYLAAFAPASLSGLGFLAVLALGIVGLAPREELAPRMRAALVVAALLAVVVLVLVNFTELWVALALIALFTATFGFMRRTGIALPLGLSILALALVLVGTRLPSLAPSTIEIRPNLSATFAPAKAALTSRHALLGTGPSTYAYGFAQNRPQEFNASGFWNARFDQGVSFLATIPATTGILGTLAWLLLVAGAIGLMRRRLSDASAAVAVLAVAFVGLGLLVYSGSFVELVVGAVALGILAGSAGQRRELAFSGPSSPTLFATFLALVVIAAGSLAGIYLVGQKYAAAAYYQAGANALGAGETDTAVARLARATNLDGGSDAYARGLSQALMAKFQALSNATSSSQQDVQGALALAVQSAQRATQVNPADSANWGALGAIYEGLTPLVGGMDEQALKAYDEAAARDPKSPAWPLAHARVYGALAQFQKGKGDATAESYAKAQEQVQRALDLKHDFVDARFLSAELYLAAGDTDAAKKRIAELRDAAPMDATLAYQVGLLYYQNSQLADAQAELERAVSLASDFADARYFLGLTYSRAGSVDKAKEQFRWIADRNKDNAEINRILENLDAGRPVLDGIVNTPQPQDQLPGASTDTASSTVSVPASSL